MLNCTRVASDTWLYIDGIQLRGVILEKDCQFRVYRPIEGELAYLETVNNLTEAKDLL